MKGRHVVIVIFVFGLSLIAILFRILPGAKPAPARPAPPAHRPLEKTPAPPPPAPDPLTAGSIEVLVRTKGSPLRGASVGFENSKANRNHHRVTEASGECSILQAEPGEWRIVARAEGVAANWTTVTVESGRTARAELDLAAGARLEGTVRDAAGAPVAGAKISMSLPDPAFTVRSDASGRYVIQDLPLGRHAVTASSERLRPHTVTTLDIATPGETRMQDFILPFGRSLSGRVVDDAGAPVPRAMVTVSNEVARVVRCDDNGDFRADGLGEGPITLSVLAKGFASASETAVAPGRTDVLVKLARGAILEGRIDGEPTSFTVHVSRYSDELSKWLLVKSERIGKDAGGAFMVRDLPPGRYEFVVEAPERKTPAPIQAVLVAGQTTNAGVINLADR
jgi:hypothetical protein